MLFRLPLVLVAALSALAASAGESTSGVFNAESAYQWVTYTYISQCNNVEKIKTCTVCEEYGSPSDFGGVCAVDTSSSGSSFVDNLYANFHHTSSDYRVGRPSGGCAPCGASSPTDSLMNLEIARHHRYRESSRGGMFGPGVFLHHEARLTLYRDNAINVIEFFDPRDLWVRKFIDGASGDVKDGIYVDQANKSAKELRLYDANGQLTTTIQNGTKAVLTRHTGERLTFEVVSIGAKASDPVAGAAPWRKADLGRVARIGDTTVDGGAFTINASGRDIWNQQDEGHFAFQALRGDGSITAKVNSLTNTNVWAKAGVMVRESLLDGSKFAFMAVTPGSGVSFQRRTETYGTPAHTTIAGVVAPQFVRLTRAGNTFTGEVSADGVAWTVVGSAAVALNADVYVGLAVTSHQDGRLTTAQIDNVTVSGTPTPTVEWPPENVSPTLVGRWMKLEDRNGYAMTLAYKSWTPAQIAVAPDRQLQLDSVTDAQGRTATFSYDANQQSGLWVVSRIGLPNGQEILYQYTDGKLAALQLPDGNTATFGYGIHPASQCTTVSFNDLSAEGALRKKTVHLTNHIHIPAIKEELAEVVNQSSLMARLVINGDEEVSYLNANNPHHVSLNENLVYEGAGKLRLLHAAWSSPYYLDGWQIANPSLGFDGIIGKKETTFQQTPINHTALKLGTYPTVTDEYGVMVSYLFDADTFKTQKTWPDGTSEKWRYNAFKQVTRHEDRLGRVTKMTYDARGNLLTREVGILNVGGTDTPQPEYAVNRFEYYPAGDVNQFLLKTEFDALFNPDTPDLHRTDYEYDARHLLIKKTESADIAGGPRAVTQYAYDAAARLISSTDPLGRTVSYQYDERDRVVKITYMDGSTERFIYGTGVDANLLVKQKDRNGNVTKFEYDLTGRRTRTVTAYSVMALDDSETLITDPSVSVEELCTYLPGTEKKATCVRSGERTEYIYDYRQRVVATKTYPRQGVALTATNTFVNNLLFSQQDPYGRKTYFNYRASDRAQIRTVRGTVPTYTLANFAAVTAATRDLTNNNAAYVIEDMELDAEGQTVARVDGRNIRHTMKYDSRGRTVEMIEAESVSGVPSADAAKTVYEYDANSNRSRVKHPRTFTEASNFFTEYTYTGRNLLKSQTEAAGKPEAATMSYTYLLDRRLSFTTDGRNNDWEQVWKQCCGRIAAKVDPTLGDGTRPFTYFQQDFFGNTTHVVRMKDRAAFTSCCGQNPGNVDTVNETTTKFDARHRPVAQTVWLVARDSVDPNDVPIAAVPSAEGLTTTWRYDENLTDGIGIDADYATQIQARLGANYFGINATGYAVETTNPAGEKSVSIYDGAGRVVLQIDGNKNSVKSTYDVVVNGLIETSVADGLDHTSKSRADGIGRVRESIDAESKVATFEYDNNGNRVKFRDANGVGQDCIFDDRNRDKQCSDTAVPPSVTKKTFDAHGNVTHTYDALNSTTQLKFTLCEFDARDRKVTCTDRIAGTTTFKYDPNNNLIQITDAENGITSYTYDPRNLLSTETFPAHNTDGGHFDIREYTYDAANRLTTRKDQLMVVTTYNYDLANRLLSRVYPDAKNDTFTYDAASRLLSATNARYSNSVVRDYTVNGELGGRLKRETQTIGGTPYQVTYDYDAANRQTSVTYPTGDVVARSFTDRNQLSAVTFNGNSVASFAYDNGMRRTQTTFANGVVEDRTYFTDNLNNTIKAENAVPTKVTDFTYTWDANKRKTGEADGIMPPLNSQKFEYDDEDRLTKFYKQNILKQEWDLSKVGDWKNFNSYGTAEARTHNKAHEILTTDQGGNPEHDVKGNLTKNTNGQKYTWDFENRLVKAEVPTGVLGTFNENNYAYDALGRRVSKTVGTTTTVFVNDGLQEICEYENGVFARSCVFGSYIDEPLRITSAAGIHYYHANQIYSVAALTDSTGGVVERYTYDPYGKATVLDAGGVIVGVTSAVGNPWTFTGRRLDGETGLMYYRARMFDTGLGRFIGRDPIKLFENHLAAGIYKTLIDTQPMTSNIPTYQGSVYEYVVSNVSNSLDPLGLKEVASKDILDGKNRLCGTARVHEPSKDGKSGIEFEFDVSKADPNANCCEPCAVEKAQYGFVQHVYREGEWKYDNGAFDYTQTDNYRAKGSPSNPKLPKQPTSRPANVDPPKKPPEEMMNRGENPKYPGKRWKQNPWYGGAGNPSGNIGNPSPSTHIFDTTTGKDPFITQLVCVKSGDVLWQHSWNGPKVP